MTNSKTPETMTYRSAYTELKSTMTRRRVETLIRFVTSSALAGCVHAWIVDEAGRKFGVRPELVRGLLAV
jgi:hypothetical protein